MEIEDIKGLLKGHTYWVRIPNATHKELEIRSHRLKEKLPDFNWLVTDSKVDVIEIPTIARDQLIKISEKLKEVKNGIHS